MQESLRTIKEPKQLISCSPFSPSNLLKDSPTVLPVLFHIYARTRYRRTVYPESGKIRTDIPDLCSLIRHRDEQFAIPASAILKRIPGRSTRRPPGSGLGMIDIEKTRTNCDRKRNCGLEHRFNWARRNIDDVIFLNNRIRNLRR